VAEPPPVLVLMQTPKEQIWLLKQVAQARPLTPQFCPDGS
jgi:hypothetical protein